MFSKRIINSGRFLKMPPSSQALYFHLGLAADDDGVVEAFTVMRSVGASEDDLKILCAKEFVRVLNEELVSYITDWRENNKIRADRKIDSIYKDLLLSMVPDVDTLEPRSRADRAPRLTDPGMGRPRDVHGTAQDRLGKDRLGKESIGEVIEPPVIPPKSVRHKYGEYKNVLLTDDDLEKLKAEFPDWEARVERLSSYIASTGKSYKNHLATIRNWARRDKADSKASAADYGSPEDFYK